MRILDENDVELTKPDQDLGCLKEERILIAHHPATPEVQEQWHYETIVEYPNGGKDVKKMVDVPGSKAREAWDEYETILRYTLYTPEELEQIKKNKNMPTMAERVETLETTTDDLILLMADLIGGV